MNKLEKLHQSNSFPFQEGYFGDKLLTQRASYILRQGGVVAMQMRGVFGMWADATNDEALDTIRAIKGQDKKKPFSTMMPISDLWHLIDLDKIDPMFERFFVNPDIFSNTFGGLLHACLPLKTEAVRNEGFPESIYSTNDTGEDPEIRNLDPTGHDLITGAISEFKHTGVPYIAVTTLNHHKEREISRVDEAKKFIRSINQRAGDASLPLPIFLGDPMANPDIPGSFAQIDMRKGRVGVIREGNVASGLIGKMLGVMLDTEGAKQYQFQRTPAYDQITQYIMSSANDEKVTPQQMRKGILSRITIAIARG